MASPQLIPLSPTTPLYWFPGTGEYSDADFVEMLASVVRGGTPLDDVLRAMGALPYPPEDTPPAPPRERKPRRPSLSRAKREAERAGLPVRGFELHPGKVVVVLGEPEPAADAQGDDEVETWIRKHAH